MLVSTKGVRRYKYITKVDKKIQKTIGKGIYVYELVIEKNTRKKYLTATPVVAMVTLNYYYWTIWQGAATASFKYCLPQFVRATYEPYLLQHARLVRLPSCKVNF